MSVPLLSANSSGSGFMEGFLRSTMISEGSHCKRKRHPRYEGGLWTCPRFCMEQSCVDERVRVVVYSCWQLLWAHYLG